MTDDGGPLSLQLAEALQAWGWPVVLLRYSPPSMPSHSDRLVPEGVSVATFDSLVPDSFSRQFKAFMQQYPPVGGFVDVRPQIVTRDVLCKDRSWTHLRATFLAAIHLGAVLRDAATEGRALFATVTRMDGALGLAGGGDFAPLDGGYSGLVKTLHTEWPDVFCRAIDLDPTCETDRAAEWILRELQDPNRRLVEVGWRAGRRVTLEALEED